MGNHLMVGGQAVIEGVMMRGPKLTATAVRDPNGKIQVETKDVNSISDRYPILKKPMLRGTVSLIESLVIGIRSLSYSAKMAGEEDEQLSDKEMAGTILFALVLASILFIAIPALGKVVSIMVPVGVLFTLAVSRILYKKNLL